MTPTGRLRADALRNQEQLLAAAREVIAERGAKAPLEEVARRAGVGIGTLYRRFPDRDALLKAVVVDALTHARDAAREALEAGDTRDGLDALARYMYAALELRVSAVIPQALDRLDFADPDIAPVREESAVLGERLVEAAHEDGSLARTVTFADIGTLLVRLSRRLPGTVSTELDDELARRHLTMVVAGLRDNPDVLEDKGVSRSELRPS